VNNLVVILGAGFSFPAGLPLANNIKERFNRVQKEKLLRMSSGEWMWEDNKDDTTVHNGKIGFDHLAYSYILNEIVNTYNEEVDEFDNYEVFFSFVLDKFDDLDWFKKVYARAKESLIEDKPFLVSEPLPHSDYLMIFDKDPHIRKIQDIFNYLIGDMLFVSDVVVNQNIETYNHFISYIQRFERVDIFTLNHDLLLEKILNLKGISFSRGFSFNNSDVYYEGKPLPIFNNHFTEKIRIHKLHGSLDFYRFQHFENDGSLFWKPTEKYNYFVTHSYRAKHYAERVNPHTKEVLQDMNFDVTPKFITGTKKTSIISNDMMYSQLFVNYERAINLATKILISGYSYSDEHINNELQKRNDIEVVNQNPYSFYPFKAKEIFQISSIEDLSSI
jgi:hypothetical protein